MVLNGQRVLHSPPQTNTGTELAPALNETRVAVPGLQRGLGHQTLIST